MSALGACYKIYVGLPNNRRVTKKGKNLRLISRLVFIGLLLICTLVLSILVEPSTAQTPSNYYVTVNPTTPNSPMYTTVGRNWNVSFEALWSYGDNSGQNIGNATVTVQVNNKSDIIDTLLINTSDGLFSFNYSSSTADVLAFTPMKLVTQDGTEWAPKLLDAANNLYGFQSKSFVVWWDTFHVSLVSYNTETSGVTKVSVNVTYLLLPEKGLNLPESDTYSHQTFLHKIVYNATVTINGVTAEETSMGIFRANVSIWFPTSYILVGVSQEGWTTTHTGFSFAQNANEPLWGFAIAISLASVVILTLLVVSRKSRDDILSRKKSYAVFGGVLLAITSVISLYWGLVGLNSTLNGFDWIFLTILGLLSFGFGLVAGILSVRRKNQALVIGAVIVPMITNLVAVKTSLDMYQLANPWLILIVPLVLSIISGVLISNADEVFAKHS